MVYGDVDTLLVDTLCTEIQEPVKYKMHNTLYILLKIQPKLALNLMSLYFVFSVQNKITLF